MDANNRTQGRYRKSFLRFMSFKNNTNYPSTHTFTNKELLNITPTDVITYLRFMAYGSPIYTPGMKLIRRSTTIKSYKRDISHHMPHQTDKWSPATSSGDPTKSKEVYKLLAIMQAAETKGEGKPSSARRALELDELRQLISLLHSSSCDMHAISYASYVKFQFHMIARLDDVAHVKFSTIEGNARYPSFPKITIEWSKNIKTENRKETQLILGADDPDFCVLLALATHIESSAACSNNSSPFVFSLHGVGDSIPGTTKSAVYAALKTVFQSASFKAEREGLLGSHSLRKCASNYAQDCGHPRSDCEMRGRWTGDDGAKGSTPYFKKTVHFTDVKVASSLCIGGAIRYDFAPDCKIDNSFLVSVVTPNAASKLPRTVAETLGKALLWAIYDSGHSVKIPSWLSSKVKAKYNEIAGGVPTGNPIQKIRVEPVGHANKVEFIDMIGNNGVSPMGSSAIQASQLSSIQSSIMQLQASMKLLSNQVEMVNENAVANTKKIFGELKKVRNQPFRAVGTTKTYHAPVPKPSPAVASKIVPIAALSQSPSNLRELWNEWEFGLFGNKAAKDFTPAERGKYKYKYCRRKRAWDLINKMTSKGMHVDDAIEKIYDALGRNRTITQLLDEILMWKKRVGILT